MTAIAGVERRLAHQAMHTALGTQETIGVVAADFPRSTLEASHITFGFFQHLDLDIAALAITQIHAQQHRSTVLCIGIAATCLDVHQTVRSESRLVGKACVSTCSTRWS